MASKFIESAIDAVISALEDETTGVNAKIAALNIELTDLSLDDIDYIYDSKISLKNLPCIGIFVEDSPGDEETNNFNINHQIKIWVVTDYEDSQENLNKRSRRYARAIVESIRATHNLDNEVDICQFMGNEYKSPWPIIDSNPYIVAIGSKFDIYKEELTP